MFLALSIIWGCQNITTGGDPPQKPTGIVAAGGNGQVTLIWDDIGADTYTVYWAAGTTVATNSPNKHSSLTGLTDAVTGLTNGTQYAFIVTASDADGESVASNIVLGTPLAPPAVPGALTAFSRTTSINVSWAAVTGAATYDLYYAQGATVDTGSATNQKGIAATSSTITGLSSNTDYALLLVAKNSNGMSTAGTVNAWKTALNAPTNTIPTYSNYGTDSFVFSWNLVSNAVSYNVYYNNSATSSVTVTTSNTKIENGASTSYPFTSLDNTKYYGFIATAVNTYGESDVSTMQIVACAYTPLSWLTPNFVWYGPWGTNVNTINETQYFLLFESSNSGTTWISKKFIGIAYNGYQITTDVTPTVGYWYRVAHATPSQDVDGFYSSPCVIP